MNHLSTFIYLLQLILYCLISDVYTQDNNIQNIFVKVLVANCTENGVNNCRNKYLQICNNTSNQQLCNGRMSDCLLPSDFTQDHTDLSAVPGTNANYSNLNEIYRYTDITVGINPTTSTNLNPPAMSCQRNTAMVTQNSFIVNTSSDDGSYKIDLLIEVQCKSLSFCGLKCETCEPTTTLTTRMVNTSENSRSTKNTSSTFTTLYMTSRLRSPVTIDTTTTKLKTTHAGSALTGPSTSTAISKEYSTTYSNGTFYTTSNINETENANKQSKSITVILVPVVCIVVLILILIILIVICYQKHKQKTRTTPAEDEKNRLVQNDNTADEDAHSSTGHLNGVQNNNVRENASSEDMAHVTTETVDETVNSRSDGNVSFSSKQNETNDITSEKVNSERKDNAVSNIITETPEDMDKSNNGMETASSVPVTTDDPPTHKHKKKKKKKKSDAEKDTPSISEDLSVRNFPADENNVIANGQNNGYVPDDEHSDAAPSNESEEVSGIDVPTSDTGDVPHQAQSNGDFHHQAQSNGNVPYQAHSYGDVPHRAQSHGDFHHQEISREEIENITQAKVETLIHGKMSEIKREITEDTNNSINQVKEEFTEKMRHQNDEIKEQISKNTADLEKTEKKRQRNKQKLEELIKECNDRLKNFQDQNMKNQEQLEEKIKASGGKQDDARRKMIENTNAIQKLRDEMNIYKDHLKQQICATDSPLLTQTSQINESSPHIRMETQDLSHSITNIDDVLQCRPTCSLVTPGIPPTSGKKRKKKKKEPRIHVTRDGSVQIKHKNNKTIHFGNMGSIEILNVKDGVGFTADSLEVEVKSTDYDVI